MADDSVQPTEPDAATQPEAAEPAAPTVPSSRERVEAVRSGCPCRPRVVEAGHGWSCPGEATPAGSGVCAAAEALAWAAGADLLADGAAVAVLLDAAQPGLLCATALERLLTAQTRLSARAAARTSAAMVALAAQAAEPTLTWTGVPELARHRVEEPGKEAIALACRISPMSAGRRLAEAHELAGDTLTVLRDLLDRGQTTLGHAFLVQQETALLPPELAAAVLGLARVHTSLRSDTPGVCAALIRRLAAELDPDHLQDREQTDETHRDARVSTGRDGRHAIIAPTTGLDAEAAQAAFEQAVAAARAAGDARSPAQMRHDLLLDPIWRSLGHAGRPQPLFDLDPPAHQPAEAGETGEAYEAGATAPEQTSPFEPGEVGEPEGEVVPASGQAGQPDTGARHGEADQPDAEQAEPEVPTAASGAQGGGCLCQRPTDGSVLLGLTMSLDSLLALTDTPAALDRYGLLSAEAARWLARTATRVRALVHDDGRLVYATPDYRFTRPAARTARHATHARCSFPGCTRDDLDLDHATPYAAGGETSLGNAVPACRRHHNLKTHHEWTTAVNVDSSEITWTSPWSTQMRTRMQTWKSLPALPIEQRSASPPWLRPDPAAEHDDGRDPPREHPGGGAPAGHEPPCPF